MDKVFEVKEIDLVDLSGDTHFVTDIQRRVQIMLGAGGGQRDQVRDSIANEGARALPGVLNATYVFAARLKRREQRVLAGLLAELIGVNKAAREMLLRNGVLEAPFAATRQTALLALQELGTFAPLEMDQIRTTAWQHAKQGDYEAALPLYECLAEGQDEQAGSELAYLAGELFRDHVDIGPTLLDLVLRCSPKNTYQVLVGIMGQMDRKGKKFGREIKLRMSPESVANLEQVLQASSRIIENNQGYKHKGIEFLFEGPIAGYLKQNPDMIQAYGSLVEENHKSLYRYWWQGLTQDLELDVVRRYFIDKVAAPLDEFTWHGGIQLLFTKKYDRQFRVWATELLDTLEQEEVYQYRNLLDAFDRFQSAPDGPVPVSPSPPSGVEGN
jgi:hypothetical protein